MNSPAPNSTSSPLQVLAPALSSDLTPLLREKRAQWNARFGQAKQQFPALDAQEFSAHLRQTMLPIVAATHAHTPERTYEVWTVLYEISLELIGRRLLGNGARNEAINRGWKELFPAIASLIIQNPRRVLGRTSNALHTLSQQSSQPDAVGNWIGAMREIAPCCHNLDDWENAGFIASWRCGLAHARERALQILPELSPQIGRIALGINTDLPQFNAEPWSCYLQVLADDRWFDPRASNEANSIQIAAQIGEFVGFGGAMSEPPHVQYAQNRFWIWNGKSWMHLCADAFGATLKPTSHAPQSPPSPPANWQVFADGTVQCGTQTQQFTKLGAVKTWAAHDKALVVTTHFSYHVFVVKC